MSDTTERRTDSRGRHADEPSDIPMAGWKDIAVRVKNEIGDDHTTLSAAGVAFYGFLAAIPALAALVSIYGLFADPAQAQSRVEDLFGALPSEAKALLSEQLESIADSSGGALSFGIVISILGSLWAASGGMGHLIEAINDTYDEDETRGFVERRLLALGFTLGAIVFIVVTIGIIAVLPAVLASTGLSGGLRWLINLALWPILAVGMAAGLAILYRYAPDRRDPEWKWVSWGAVVAVGVWILASIGFRFYAANFGSYNETYGSLAAVVILLFWLFITAFVVLLGAQVNSEMEHQTTRDSTEDGEQPMGRRDAVMADTVGESAD